MSGEILTPDKLSPTQAEMLACGEFHVDGSMRPAGIEAAAALECKGFATSTIGGDSQYTAINYTVTESGKDALIAYVKAQAAKLAKVREGLEAVSDLIAASDGVYGLHHNGDGAPWDELRAGGRFEGWLADFDAAIAILENQS